MYRSVREVQARDASSGRERSIPHPLCCRLADYHENRHRYHTMQKEKRQLNNYLRTHRKRLGFSQSEIARLCACHCGTKVSRYERFEREPTLRNALIFEAIFHMPVRQLFPGIFQEVEHRTILQARALLRRLEDTESKNPATSRKIIVLREIAGSTEAEKPSTP